MAFEKELALALDYKNAPKEVQDAATKHYDNLKALKKTRGAVDKARENLNDAQAKVSDAAALAETSERDLKSVMSKWTPEV